MEFESESENERDQEVSWEEKEYTLIFCRKVDSENRPEILLGMKKRGFGIGKWNGYGGKLEESETIEECAKRELQEECNIVARKLQRMGFLCFKMIESSKILRVHVFQTSEFDNEAIETEEMKPRWYLESEIPYEGMWPDDQHWLPLLLENKRFIGRFAYEDDDTIIDFDVKEQR
jgi:8-oxo-dGTP diphosphatase / 2-hydroxy-dATP diphosphatase